MSPPIHRALFSLLLFVSGTVMAAIEEPRFEVVSRDRDFEIRRYAPYLVAETWVSADFGSAGNQAFRRLFRYITGANRSGAKISMTAPVAQRAAGERIDMTAPVTQLAGEGGYWVSFMVPSSFTPDTVPQPTDPQVRIREVPAQLMAVARYAGTWRESSYQKKLEQLQAALRARGLVTVGTAQFARYNPPYMPPFLRRNEILFPLAGTQAVTAPAGTRGVASGALN